MPVRADVLLADAYPQYSRAALAKLFSQDAVMVDDDPAKAGDKIKPGHDIEADISNLQKQAESITMPIIYEDENVVVVDKPAGIISHARGKYWDEPSVASFIRDKVADLSGERAGIVHRLDRATSGVMVCAKNPETLKFLQKQFSDRRVSKSYIAIVQGQPEQESAKIDIPLERNPNKPQTFRASANGKYAITEYKTLATNNKLSMLLLQPQTGRTHQLRVHLQHIGYPIIGDVLYQGPVAARLYLHAYSLKIILPKTGPQVFYSPLPPEFIEEMAL